MLVVADPDYEPDDGSAIRLTHGHAAALGEVGAPERYPTWALVRQSEGMASAAGRTTRAGSMPGRKVVRSRDDGGPRIGVATSSPSVDWLWSIQRLAGNRAASALLRERAVQRAEPAAAPTPAPSSTDHGREPTPSEHNQWDGVVADHPWLVLRSAENGYNCFAWAVGSTSFILTYAMVEPSGSSPTLDVWTTYLATQYGFARSADGLDPSADLILYGDSPTQILHAARRADEPYGELTFSSKIGGGVTATPVILHAPADIQGNLYGHALRSFWRAPASEVQPAPPAPTQ